MSIVHKLLIGKNKNYSVGKCLLYNLRCSLALFARLESNSSSFEEPLTFFLPTPPLPQYLFIPSRRALFYLFYSLQVVLHLLGCVVAGGDSFYQYLLNFCAVKLAGRKWESLFVCRLGQHGKQLVAHG